MFYCVLSPDFEDFKMLPKKIWILLFLFVYNGHLQCFGPTVSVSDIFVK